jgi:regulator of protease activity HflC (stomatin/prohibitin superfamily)
MDSNRVNNNRAPAAALVGLSGFIVLLLVAVIGGYVIYSSFRIEVPTAYMAILTHKTGKDLPNADEIAPSAEYKGVQQQVLTEGRYFYNPYNWSWKVVPQIEIPQGKLGVRIRLHGEELPYGEIIAKSETQKGIVADVLRPGRHAINGYIRGDDEAPGYAAELIELHDPVVIPAGFKGVVTKVAASLPANANKLLSDPGTRGVQEAALHEQTYYVNPYVTRIHLIDCRSQRFNLESDGDMGFPSKDGFWVSLDGIIEFRVKPEEAARVFVIYNEASNDGTHYDAKIDQEIIKKVILPNARSFCRLKGSAHSGKEFISGETRSKFQAEFQESLKNTCQTQGIEIIQALITRINPPEKIADPVQKRQIAIQEEEQYKKQLLQQTAEKQLIIDKETIKQKQAIVGSEQEVIKLITQAEREQEVTLIDANQRLKVAEFELSAAEDLAAAEMARGKAAAEVIEFQNAAEAAGWKKSVDAFGGNGDLYARWVLLKKLAPAFRQMMVNTADSPLMDFFEEYNIGKNGTPSPTVPATVATPATAGSDSTSSSR